MRGGGYSPFKYRYTLYMNYKEIELRITTAGQEALRNHYYSLADFPFEKQVGMLKSELERERTLRMKEVCTNK